ncbi:hypothetical protein Leryth_004166 [Lithospermum erythrorhizon]|nr:hypothetical protein Leryth_004166 [Lithospermum erythrorhizon]
MSHPNPTSTSTTDPAAAPPPQPPQPHRSSCTRHPDEHFTGFCPSCLFERLITLDQSSTTTTTSRRNSTSTTTSAAAAIKALFTKPTTSTNNINNAYNINNANNGNKELKNGGLLRRSKSFSAAKNEALGVNIEPQRRSCDVRNTLSSLFSMENGELKMGGGSYGGVGCSSGGGVGKDCGFLGKGKCPHLGSGEFCIAGGSGGGFGSSGGGGLVNNGGGGGFVSSSGAGGFVNSGGFVSNSGGVGGDFVSNSGGGFVNSSGGGGFVSTSGDGGFGSSGGGFVNNGGFGFVNNGGGGFVSSSGGGGFMNRPVLESKEEEEDEDEEGGGGEIESEEEYEECEKVGIFNELEQPRVSCCEIEKEEVMNESSTMKPIKDYLDLDSQTTKTSSSGMKEIAGSFWSAASVFSKKWQNWRRKQKLKKQNNGGTSGTLPVEKPLSRQFRETQSEVADYGYGRRSCDIDPRFSLDAGRISFDDPRYSFEEPRASWDGYVMGRSFPKMHPMVSLVEDAPVVHVPRTDAHIPVEEVVGMVNRVNEDESVPGGTTQTRDYYADSSSRRRKSLDRCSSTRKIAASVVAELDEMKAASNAKVSPAAAACYQGAKVLVGERISRDSNSNSLRDDCSETFELGSLRDNASVIGNGEHKGTKKSRKWSWKLWGLMQRRNGRNKDEDDERYSGRVNGVSRSLSESWQEFRRDMNGEPRGGGLNRNVFRSNSSVSWRNSANIGSSSGNVKKLACEMNGQKKRDEITVLKNKDVAFRVASLTD